MIAPLRLFVVPVLVSAAACAPAADPNRLRVSGHVEATEVRLAPEMGGRVLSLPVKEGDRLQAGATVLTIDATDLQLAIARAKTEQASAEAQVRLVRASARSGYRFLQFDVKPEFVDTPRNWDLILETVFYNSDRNPS